jgi:YD repeat-containing protein
MKTNMQQAPIRNATTICASVYSHSGEFAPVYTDLQLTGRGLDFQFTRSYRSSFADHIGELGRGWFSSIAKRIERRGDDIIYHNGAGELYKFLGGMQDNYKSPIGFYGFLLKEKKEFLLYQRYGLKYRFEIPEQGGRILGIEDRNHNSIQFSYSENAVVIIDSLKRTIDISINKGLMKELKDHAGRTWKYLYDKNDCLIEVNQPATADFPNGTTVKYAYDNNHRLISVTDAKGQKYLVNHYDKSGKVVAQEHGCGVFNMEYDAIGEGENGLSTHRTTCIRKNGSKLVLEHSEVGNVLSRTLYVRKESFAPQDIKGISGNDVPLITNSVYNKNLELTSRIFPAGNKTEWVYSEDAEDSLNQGNLLQIIKIPQTGVESDQTRTVTKYEVELKFQLTTKLMDSRGNQTSYEYDEKGNLIVTTYPSVTIQPVNRGTPRPTPLNRVQKDEYQYNSMGQLLRRKHIDESITEYYYYPIDDSIGSRRLNSATNNPDMICGYLARVVRDANGKKIKNEYAYDHYGNATTVLDGKSNPARLRYNAMGKVECVTSREPFKHRIDYKYDANYNEIESAQSFERFELDEKNQTTRVTPSTLRELKEYNTLDNVTLRKIVGSDKIIVEYFVRDGDEKIIRQIQPLGNATEYVYDERNLLIEKIYGVGTRETFSNRFTYTLNGALRTYTDGNGKKTTHHYDGFHRYKGFTNPIGTKKTQWFDEADNVVRVEIDGDKGSATKKSRVGHRGSAPLMETNYNFDQWNRVYRVDKAWHNHSNGHTLGKSQWNGEEGIVSTILEYAENGLPGKVWTETDNVVGFEYDGVGRVIQIKDLTGEEFSFEYDENNNPTLLKHLGPEVEGRRFEQVVRRSHDEMDRLVRQQENDEAPERFGYNALGNVINYVGKSGIEIHYNDDDLGRRDGHVFTITDALDSTTIQKIVRRFEYDDNYRLSAYTDAAGKRTVYRYDTLDRRTGVVFPDGNAANVEYDAHGNIVRVVDQNNNEINNRYDASNRLIERSSYIHESDKIAIEQYEYDGLNRMVGATSPDAVIRRTYDSLSYLLTEQQGDHVLECVHDSAGNLTNLVYPGGEEVHKTYDIRKRVTSLRNKAGETIASFIYRADNQIAKMLLGNVIEADFSYNLQERLESIEYTRTDNHRLVEGFQYQYDSTGKMTHEIQLSVGATYGDRYYYDDANRATKAQYGVQDVFDPNSSYEQETLYEHFPEGSWKRRVDIDGEGKVIAEKVGTINQLNSYQNFGKLSFAYDANGNCTRKGKSNPGYCDYTYDQDNRLIKSECYDAQGNKTQMIEYSYDSLGRQVRKVVTDKNGNITETTYVWVRNILIEEYENGVLVRTYFYGIDSMPVQLSGNKGSYYYTLNGNGLVSGLVVKHDVYAFADKYRYEVLGAAGMPMPPALRNPTNPSVVNSIISGDYLLESLNGTFSRYGMQFDPAINEVLNAGTGFGGGGNGLGSFMSEMNKYFPTPTRSGSRGMGPAVTSSPNSGVPGMAGTTNPAHNQSLVSEKLGGPFDFSPPPPPMKTTSDAERLVQKVMDNPVVKVVIEVASHIGPSGPMAPPAPPGPAGTLPFPAPPDTAHGPPLAPAPPPDPPPDPDPPVAPEPAGPDPDPDPTVMVDPDAGSGTGGPIRPLSPQQVEAKLNYNKHPLNPNGGFGSPEIDPPSSQGPSKIDLIAHYDDSHNASGVRVDDTLGAILGRIWNGSAGSADPTPPDLPPQ